jgi:CRISPR-associated protein Csa1
MGYSNEESLNMFHVSFGEFWCGKDYFNNLNEMAKTEITTRGYHSKNNVPPELADPKWFLPLSDIAYSYCPTNRYLYLKKVENKRPASTWSSCKGRIIDDLIPRIFAELQKCSIGHSLDYDSFRFNNECKAIFEKIVTEYKSNVTPDDMIDKPVPKDIDTFFEDLMKLTTYETLLATAFLNYRISNLYDINVESEFKVLFPFDFKLKIKAPMLGISGSAEVDFLLRESILGEVKSIERFDFYNVGLAGYALAYEADRKTDVNLGVIVCPVFSEDRVVPLFNNLADIKIVSEVWRKMFIKNRNARIELIKNKTDPGAPPDNSKCIGCGFFEECW